MKNLLLVLITAITLGSAICPAQAQTEGRDMVYLKNGSILKGKIVEFIPDKGVKIQVADGSIFAYTMSEVEKITKEPNYGMADHKTLYRPPNHRASRPDSLQNKNGLAIYGGLSQPFGEFGATYGENPGFAQAGFTLGLDVRKCLSPELAWMTSANLSVNACSYPEMHNIGFSGENGYWATGWLLTGLKLAGNPSPGVELFCFGQAGAILSESPEVNLYNSYYRVTQKSSSASELGFGFGAGITLDHTVLCLRYLSGEPEYMVTATITDGTYSDTYSGVMKQPISCLLLTAGYSF